MSFDPVRSSLPPIENVSRELLRRHQAGESGALDELLGRYLPRVTRIVSARLGSALAKWIEVDDVVQEMFRRTLDALDDFVPRDDKSLMRLFATKAEQVIRDEHKHGRRDKRDRRREVGFDPHASHAHPAGVGDSPSQDVSKKELAAWIDEIVHGLEPDLREVFVQRVYLESTWEETRVALDLTTRQAAERLYTKAQLEIVKVLARGRPGPDAVD